MRDLPRPLPPGERTVGQLVGETIRAFGNGFLRLLPLGLPLAVVDQLSIHQSAATQAIVFWVAAPFVVGAYVYACSHIYDVPPAKGAFLVGLLVYAPFPALELRAISNRYADARGDWHIQDALDALTGAVPRLLEAFGA